MIFQIINHITATSEFKVILGFTQHCVVWYVMGMIPVKLFYSLLPVININIGGCPHRWLRIYSLVMRDLTNLTNERAIFFKTAFVIFWGQGNKVEWINSLKDNVSFETQHPVSRQTTTSYYRTETVGSVSLVIVECYILVRLTNKS